MLIFTRNNYQQLSRLLGMSLVVVLMALFITPDAFAGKPDGNRCNPKKDPNACQPGPTPDSQLTSVTPAFISFGGTQVDGGANVWTCNETILTYANGLYTCPTGDDKAMWLRTSGGSTTRDYAGKYSEICERLNGSDSQPGEVLIPDSMSYGWTDGCNGASDTTCAIEVNMHFSDGDNGGKITGITNGKANTLSVVLHGTVNTARDVDNAEGYRESNPFYFPRIVEIDSFDLDFRNEGSRRTAAQCTVYVVNENNVLVTDP